VVVWLELKDQTHCGILYELKRTNSVVGQTGFCRC
jgi:hypothetical protein